MPISMPIREPVSNQLLAALLGKRISTSAAYLEQATLSFGEILYERVRSSETSISRIMASFLCFLWWKSARPSEWGSSGKKAWTF